MFSLSILMAVLACVIWDAWWPMLAVGADVMAVMVWGMFQPGIGCVVKGNTAFMDGNTGLCGPPVFELWGSWLTAFFGASSFGVAVVLFRTEQIESGAFWLTMISVLSLYATAWYAVATSDPPQGGGGADRPVARGPALLAAHPLREGSVG